MRTLTEVLLDALTSTKIFEMAYSRDQFIKNASYRATQIVQNWCLIKYCNLYDEENYNRLHWSKELLSHLEDLRIQKLKGGINKLRTTRYALIDCAELNDAQMIKDVLENKWKDENLPWDIVDTLANAFVNDLNKICELIANKSNGDLRNYVYNEI